MAHKYLNEIGIPSTDICIPNTENIPTIDNTDEIDIQKVERYEEERAIYGFDSRETWAIDYTFAAWLYEHLMLYKDIACVDLNYYKVNISTVTPNDRYNRTTIHTTIAEAIDIMCDYCKYFLQHYDSENEDILSLAYERIKCTIDIFQTTLYYLGW